VIAYLLFSQGSFPFDGESEAKIYKKIKQGKVYLPPQGNKKKSQSRGYDWNTMMSEPAKSFVRSLLTTDQAKRPSAKEALEHQWFTERR